uniref:NADH dehydrogenase subunit 2 n=1 Tax=Anastatus shichengensis TaxID=3025492 RepID=UPI0023AA7361|nr:NADH dehydrogenase subunit 2 [Anastatus shichengensis]WCO11519.1 NADH dehydrogenase subunit 2 [Anastatus shichengensis]
MFSTLLIFISSSWMSMWMIMELNSLSFLMMLIFNKNLKYEIPMIFFLIQSFNSYLFLMSSMNLMTFNFFMMIIWFSMISKMGIPPFYLWYLKIMKSINWTNFFFFSTIQKIIPLIILNNSLYFMNNNLMKFFSLNLMLSSIFSSIISMNFTSIKIILSFSSMNQMSWIILISMINELTMINFFLTYLMIMMNLTMIFNKFNINYLNNMNLMKFNNNFSYLLMNLSMFSLASIPPFTGFLMKWISIQMFFNYMNFFMIMILIFSTIISTFIYIRIIFINILNLSISTKMNFKNINFLNLMNFNFPLINWMSLTFLFFYEII